MMGEAKRNKGKTDYDPAKVVSLVCVFTDWTDPRTGPRTATCHVDVETTAIETIADHTKDQTSSELAQAMAEGFLASKHLEDTEGFAMILCAYVGHTRNYLKLKEMMPHGASGFWVKINNNSSISQCVARPALIAPRDTMMTILDQVRRIGPQSIDNETFMNLIGSPLEPHIMNGYDPKNPPHPDSVSVSDFKPEEGKHGSVKLTGRWYSKH
jgi:hypothetical protein